MKYIEILTAFETEIGVINSPLDKPSTDDSMFWLNQAVNKFVKLRFNGDTVHHTGYEQTEKRRSDLDKLYKSVDLTYSSKLTEESEDYDVYTYSYPTGFMYELGENVLITDTEGGNKLDTCVFECTVDSLMYRINNSLTDFHYRSHRARPLRLRTDSGCRLYTDKNYLISRYTLIYLRKPAEITLDLPFSEYTDFEESTMYEIIKMAAQMYLENTGNKRYETISNEVLTQE